MGKRAEIRQFSPRNAAAGKGEKDYPRIWLPQMRQSGRNYGRNPWVVSPRLGIERIATTLFRDKIEQLEA
jgi:hypothetical protein